jgi:hypothetical protein
MKVINLNESQYKRLFEVSQGALSYQMNTPSNIPEFKNQEEVGDDAKITDKDGFVKNQDPEDTNRKQKTMAKTYPSGWAGMR